MEEPKDRDDQEPGGPPSTGLQFFWEVVIFLTGIFIGIFWHIYFQNSGHPEAHIIIGLIVIIICMSRYVFLLWQRQK